MSYFDILSAIRSSLQTAPAHAAETIDVMHQEFAAISSSQIDVFLLSSACNPLLHRLLDQAEIEVEQSTFSTQ